MSSPLISIIIPVYNVEPYLHRCLDSIINQTYKNLEIILIDDGSTDKSGLICDEYKKKDSRIIVIHQKNQGVSAARNAGLDIFKGEYVSFIDSDDYVDLRFIEELYNNLIQYDTDIATCGMYVSNIDKTIEIFNSIPRGNCTIRHFFDLLLAPVYNKLYKKCLFVYTRFDTRYKIFEDAELNYRIYTNDKNVSATDNILYYYCRREHSAIKFNEKYTFYYCDVDILANRLIYFHSSITNNEVNTLFRECYDMLIKAINGKNTLFKKEGVKSYRKMFDTVYKKICFKNKIIGKYPRLFALCKRCLYSIKK